MNVNNKAGSIIAALLLLVTFVSVTAWHRAREALHESRSQLVVGTLEPLAALLRDNQALLKELQAAPSAEKDATGILGSYLAKIRRDGVAKHADMKQRLDQLAENNIAAVTLIKAYTSQARTPAFTAEADRFRDYSVAWRDRWNSVMELFMAGGNYPASDLPFPKDFPAALDAEIAAAK